MCSWLNSHSCEFVVDLISLDVNSLPTKMKIHIYELFN